MTDIKGRENSGNPGMPKALLDSNTCIASTKQQASFFQFEFRVNTTF